MGESCKFLYMGNGKILYKELQIFMNLMLKISKNSKLSEIVTNC